jgi:hypothetical protein
LLAAIDTITLVTRRVDFFAPAAFLAAPFAGQIGARLILPRKWARLRVRAPIALFGGSSTSVGLCLTDGGSRRVRRAASCLKCCVALSRPFYGLPASRCMDRPPSICRSQMDRCRGAVLRAASGARTVATGVMAMAPIVVILVILILRHDSPLQPCRGPPDGQERHRRLPRDREAQAVGFRHEDLHPLCRRRSVADRRD